MIRPLGLALALAGGSAAAQNVIGQVDYADHVSIVGWACLAGDAETQLSIELWAHDLDQQRWTRLAVETANRPRLDIERAGVCGSGSGAGAHGFEYTVLPESLIAERSTLELRAYVAQGGTPLPLPGGATVSFKTAGLPSKSDVWRTDYDNPAQRVVSMLSCIWPYKGANANEATDSRDPLFLHAGPTLLTPWERHPGVFALPNYCVQNTAGDDARWAWSRSNAATNASGWPRANYWVVSANNELAYSTTQSGPPGQSEALNQGGLYTLRAEDGGFVLGLRHQSPDYSIDDTPFLSIGAQTGRGVSGPLAWVEPTGADTWLQFSVAERVRSNRDPGDYHDIIAFIELMWGGYKRYLAVSLMQTGLRHQYHWNWNVLESFWFPGGEFVLLGSETIRTRCDLTGAELPAIAADAPIAYGKAQSVAVPIRALLECIEREDLSNLHAGLGTRIAWSTPRPRDLPLAITGIHLAIEQGPNRPESEMLTWFSKPKLLRY